MSYDDIQYPSGFGLEDVVAWGSTSLVVLDAAAQTVIKTPFDDDHLDFILRERQIYERFTSRGGHQGILSYHGEVGGKGVRLDYASNHDLQSYLKSHEPNHDQRLRWMTQLAEALDFIHSTGVVHGDLTTANMLLDGSLNAKLADFAGSSIDSSPLLIVVTTSHEYPGDLLSAQGDMFAFGSAMYEIFTGEGPSAALGEYDVQARYRNREFSRRQNTGQPRSHHQNILGRWLRQRQGVCK